MQGFINLLRGSVYVRITGAFPERFLNLCSQRGIGFWRLEWLDANTLRMKVAKKHVKILPATAERAMCDLTIERRMGMPFFLARFRTRYALLLGFALSLAAACMLSRFILTIEVSGNERVSTAVIIAELQRQGVTIGTYGPAVDERVVSHKMLMSLRDLSFFAINLHGTRAEVIVREADPAPAVVDERIPTNVVSAATGIITRMEVLAGEAKFKEGDTVLRGEVLISGVVDIKEPAYSTGDLGVMLVHAQGNVYARTWRTMKAVIPIQADVKYYTGQKITRVSLTVLGRRINFYRNGGISFPKYDKISKSKTPVLPGGTVLPLSLNVETCRAYTTLNTDVDPGAAEQLLKEHLTERLRTAIGDGDVLRADYTCTEQEGLLIVTLLAECREQIARVVPLAQP